ncbi:MAG: hypothetical protein IPJ88_07795 [Myxococcales bacterium]|nr:MAG: hypothetical protein IPJ88_07795 [Myxococcales bacterium]
MTLFSPLRTLLPTVAALALASSSAYGQQSTETAQQTQAQAETVGDAAKAHFKAAQSLYEAGSFASAAKEFQEAYRLSNRAEILYNIYVAYRDAGEPEQAALYLEQYLEQVPNAPDRPQLEAKLESLKKLVSERENAKRAAEQKETSAETNSAQAQHDSTEETSFTADVLPWILIGVGAAALATAAVTGIISLGKTSSIEDNCPGNICPSDYDLASKRDSAQTFTTLSDVLLFGGAGFAITGAVLLLVLDGSSEKSPRKESLSASAGCTMAFCGAALKGRF